jgi:hypothetical protein
MIFGECHRPRSVASWQQEREVLAPDAGGQVGSANAHANGVGCLAQDEISDLVTATVVDPLEVGELNSLFT